MQVNSVWKSLADTFSMVRTAVEMVFFEAFSTTLTKKRRQLSLSLNERIEAVPNEGKEIQMFYSCRKVFSSSSRDRVCPLLYLKYPGNLDIHGPLRMSLKESLSALNRPDFFQISSKNI